MKILIIALALVFTSCAAKQVIVANCKKVDGNKYVCEEF